MTTTSHFQRFPNYYYNPEDCAAGRRAVTNDRYDGFEQLHFTAGDEAQFEQFRDASNGSICEFDIDLSTNIHSTLSLPENVDWIRYGNLSPTAVTNTFKYIFHKMKKGIFIKIKDGSMRVFLPFSNARFVNEWGSSIKVSPGYQDFQTFFNHTSELVGLRGKKINRDPSKWYGNNCLVRAEVPFSEGDSSFGCMYDMFDELCKSRKVPDCEFFVNKRDFPIMTKDETEPYDCMFPADTPLLSHKYRTYAPILSMVSSDKFADIVIPTWEDWARTSNELDGRLFDKGRKYDMTFDVEWKDKFPTAVFRGASTGIGTTIETNPRLKLAKMNLEKVVDSDGVPLLDAGITKWNVRPRKESHNNYLTTIEMDKLGIPLITPLTPEEQSRHKYVVNVDGHVSAFRLSLEMKMGSVILLVDSKYRLWYHKLLVPYEHYIPVKRDLSDLYDQIRWCKTHDEECKKIVENCKKFYKQYLSRDSILDYLQNLLVTVKKTTGHYLYNETKMSTVLEQMQREQLGTVTPSSSVPRLLPSITRTYGMYKGIEKYFSTFGNGLDALVGKVGTVEKLQPVSFNGVDMLAKESSVHESFIGMKCVNRFLKDLPNFMYTFGRYEKDGKDFSVIEKIDGVPLSDYIKSDKYNVNDLVSIFIQLGLSIEYAQRECGFVHWDLYPWNVLVSTRQDPIVLHYPLMERGVYTVSTKVIPIIIDYGRSQGVFEGHVYKKDLVPVECRLQDMISVILSTFDCLLSTRRDSRDVRIVMHIINKFFARTDYLPYELTNVRDLKEWLSQRRKYSEMLYSNKGQLGARDVLALVEFLMRVEGQTGVQITGTAPTRLDQTSPEIVFEHLTNVEKDPSEHIQSVVDKIVHHKNLFKMYRQAQELEAELVSIENTLKLCEKKLPHSLVEAHQAVAGSIRPDACANLIRYTKYIYPSNPVGPHYTPDSLEDPHELLRLIMYLLNDYTNEKKMVCRVLSNTGKYKLPDEAKKFYTKNFRNILNMSTFAVLTDMGKRNTFIAVVSKIMHTNIEKHPTVTLYKQILQEIEF
jgi:serine/threonine protein kinase